MKISKMRLASFLTACLLLAEPVGAAYTGLGEVYSAKREQIGQGLSYTALYSESMGLNQQSCILEYTPGKGTLPLVRYGSNLYGKDRLASLVTAADSTAQPILAALNGDFYDAMTGVPLGVMIDGGKLLSSDEGRWALGFKADGSAVIGRPAVSMTVTDSTRRIVLPAAHFNKVPDQKGAALVTSELAPTSLSCVESLEIVVKLTGTPKAKGQITGSVTDIVDGDCNTSIPAGCGILTIPVTDPDYENFREIRLGDQLAFDFTCAEGWDQITTALGGGDLILENGMMPGGVVDEDSERARTARTAVGLRRDGTVVFFAVDGAASIATASSGLTLAELSDVMAELDCVTALNLDGGSSTTVMVRSDANAGCVYVSTPIEKTYRSLANAVLFVGAEKSNGAAAGMTLSPASTVLLRESSLSFTGTVRDRAWVTTGEIIQPAKLSLALDPDAKYDPSVGFCKDGVFTAGLIPGQYRLTASAKSGKTALSADTIVTVTDKIDALNVSPSYIRVAPGSRVPLTIEAKWKGLPVASTPSSYYFTLNGEHIEPDQKAYPGALCICDLGVLMSDGSFRAFTGVEGDVVIGVWFDEFVRYARIRVGDGNDTISSFDSPECLGEVNVATGSGMKKLSVAYSDRSWEDKGSLALSLTYSPASYNRVLSVNMTEDVFLSNDAQSIRLRISGEPDADLYAVLTDEAGQTYDVAYEVTKDYSRQVGWNELTAVIPQSLRTGSMRLTTLLAVNDSKTFDGTIYIDGAELDYGDDQSSALVGIDKHWAKDAVETLFDMTVIEASDCVKQKNGTLYYNPDLEMSRGEFAKLLVRWLGYDTSVYSGSFRLESNTSEALVPYINTALAYGLMSGRGTDANGVTIFDASAPIVRQEVFKVIGLLLPDKVQVITFTDKAEIEAWAYQGIERCVAAGILTGYSDGTVRPNATITRAELASLLTKIK